MKSVQELIALGKVPSDTTPADNQTGYPNGWPIFTDLSKQVRFDWDNLPSDRVRSLKNDASYKAALEAFLLEGSTPVIPAAGPDVALSTSVEEEIEKAKVAAAAAKAATVVADEPVIPAPVVPLEEEAEGTKSGPYTKVKGGWEARVEPIDGSGVQVYRGKTKDEVSQKLVDAAAHAQAKIRQQAQEREQLLLDEPADLAPVKRVLQPPQLTADEQFEYAEAITSGDPTRIHKAQEKWNNIRNGGTPEQIADRIRVADEAIEHEAYKSTAKLFIKQNEDVVFTAELGDKMDAILLENKWAYTVRNLNKVLQILKSKNEVELKVSSEVELPVPASASSVTAPAVPAAAAAAVVPAATVPAVKATPTIPALLPGERVRPGSASTGATPRQTSVRQGQQPATPVGLTAEEYNRMSVSETRRKYKTDLGFKTAVDKLIAEGKI